MVVTSLTYPLLVITLFLTQPGFDPKMSKYCCCMWAFAIKLHIRKRISQAVLLRANVYIYIYIIYYIYIYIYIYICQKKTTNIFCFYHRCCYQIKLVIVINTECFNMVNKWSSVHLEMTQSCTPTNLSSSRTLIQTWITIVMLCRAGTQENITKQLYMRLIYAKNTRNRWRSHMIYARCIQWLLLIGIQPTVQLS